jgi:ribosomal protein L29
VSRAGRIALLAAAVAAFVVLSLVIARVLTIGNAERDAVYRLVRAEAAGDQAAVLSRVHGCAGDAGCVQRVRRTIARVQHSGRAKLLRFDGPGGIALTGRSGPARVAWKVGTALPVVQCVRLRTTGDPVGGYTVRITGVDEPTALDEPC